MTIVISSQKMYSLVNNFEARPAESLMKKRRGTTSSISCWFWSLGRERLRQNWRRSRLDVDISVVATTSSLNYSLRLVVTTFTQTRQPERPTSSESPVMESSRGSTSHLRLHHHPAPPGTSWWRINRITLCRKVAGFVKTFARTGEYCIDRHYEIRESYDDGACQRHER